MNGTEQSFERTSTCSVIEVNKRAVCVVAMKLRNQGSCSQASPTALYISHLEFDIHAHVLLHELECHAELETHAC